jgi:hypothetical protein
LHRAVSEFGKDFFGSAVLSPLAKHLRAGFSGEDQKGKKQQKKRSVIHVMMVGKWSHDITRMRGWDL